MIFMVQENKLYQLDGYNVQAGYQGSPDEIVLQSSSTLTPIDSENFPEIRFDFKPLQDLCTLPENTSVGKLNFDLLTEYYGKCRWNFITAFSALRTQFTFHTY